MSKAKQNCIQLHYWVINSSVPINRLFKNVLFIKLYYFVAVLSLTYMPILPTFFKNKKR